MNYKLLYKDFLTKAATFSYDDGTFYDVFLAELLNKYGLKATFNINTGLFGANCHIDMPQKRIYHNRLSKDQVISVCAGHELAAHSLTHPLLVGQTKEFLDEQVLTDLANIERMTGQRTVGFAYPGGPHDEFTDKYLSDKVLYARTIENTYDFELPQSFVPLNPTVFHLDAEFLPLCEKFVLSKPDHATWLYIWGHSYEFSLDNTYNNFVKACELLSSRDDIWFATNRDIINYVVCGRKLQYRSGEFVNDTDVDIYIEYQGKKRIIKANSSCKA